MKKTILIIILVILTSSVGFGVFKFFEFQKMKNNCLTLIQDYNIGIYFVKGSYLEKIKALQEKVSAISLVKQSKITTAQDALNSFIERHKGNEIILKQLNELSENPLSSSMNIFLRDEISDSRINDIQREVEQQAHELNLSIDRITNNFQFKTNASNMVSKMSFYKYITDNYYKTFYHQLCSPVK